MAMDEYYYEVCFTVSPDVRTNQITCVKPDHIFYGNKQEDLVFKVRADSEEEAEEKARKLLTNPEDQYVRKYGPGFEVKTKFVRKVIYM
jgi:hypothetical protein